MHIFFKDFFFNVNSFTHCLSICLQIEFVTIMFLFYVLVFGPEACGS